jgi:L-aspartate oxidase
VGIVRSDERLSRAEARLEQIDLQNRALWARAAPVTELVELRNVIETARLIVRSASLRKESRGLHFTIDHPHRDNERWLRDTILPE